MPARSVILTEHFDRFIEASIDSGRFSDADELVREGLRLLEEREQDERVKIEWLRSAAKEGFDAFERGDFRELDPGAEMASFLESIHDEVATELTRGSSGI